MVSCLHNVKGGRSNAGIIIASTAVISLLFLPLTGFAKAQQGEETAFLPYLNPTHGIFMQYPSNWIASISGLADYTELIAFYSPLQNLSDLFPARLTISVTAYSQNISLPEYTNSVLSLLNQSEQGVDVRSSSEVTIAGYPGYRVVLAAQPFENSTFYNMNTWTTLGNKVYLLKYQGEESTFNLHLPEVSQMLETFMITSNNNMTTTATGGENQIQQNSGNQSGANGGPLSGLFGGGGNQQQGGNQTNPLQGLAEGLQNLLGGQQQGGGQ